MGIGAAVASGTGAESDGSGLFDPLFGGEDKTVESGLDSNPVEFDGIKTWVVEPFPDPEELDGAATAQPIANDIVRVVGIFQFGDVGQANEVLTVVGEDGYARALHLNETAFWLIAHTRKARRCRGLGRVCGGAG